MSSEHTVWALCEVQPDGSYQPTIAFTDDIAVTLTPDTAVEYALAVLEAVQAADYDAAILAQVRTLGLDDEAAFTWLAEDVRPGWPPRRETGTPLQLVPGISHRDRRGFLTVRIGGVPAGQWELADARAHALAVLECAIAAGYDTAYHRALTKLLHDDGRARAVVAEIERYRQDWAVTGAGDILRDPDAP